MTTNVIPFPGCRYVSDNTPSPQRVVVAPAPDGRNWIAWVRTAYGDFVLERTPDKEHAIQDARSYASRHGIDVVSRRAPIRARG